MAKIPTQFIQSAAKNAASKVDVKAIRKTAIKAGENLTDQAAKVKEAAIDTKEDIEKKLTELDHVLEASITEYNDAFTLMNDKGIQLYVERSRASDVIENVEVLVNSIANHPKDFDVDFEPVVFADVEADGLGVFVTVVKDLDEFIGHLGCTFIHVVLVEDLDVALDLECDENVRVIMVGAVGNSFDPELGDGLAGVELHGIVDVREVELRVKFEYHGSQEFVLV